MAHPLNESIERVLRAEMYLWQKQHDQGPERERLEREAREARERLDQTVRDLAAAERAPQPAHTGVAAWPPFPFRRLVVAYDGTERARWALDLAGRIASAMKGRILLVNVATPPVPVATDYVVFTAPAEVRDQLVREGEGLLRTAAARLPADVPREGVCRIGEAATEIVRSATEHRADLIVMGAHGRGRFAGFLLGSTAQAVIQRAPCPVLTVAHEPAKEVPADVVPATHADFGQAVQGSVA